MGQSRDAARSNPAYHRTTDTLLQPMSQSGTQFSGSFRSVCSVCVLVWSTAQWLCAGVCMPAQAHSHNTTRHGHGVDRRICDNALRGRTVRCARAVRKVGCFPPPEATGPRMLISAPYSPVLVHRGLSVWVGCLPRGPGF